MTKPITIAKIPVAIYPVNFNFVCLETRVHNIERLSLYIMNSCLKVKGFFIKGELAKFLELQVTDSFTDFLATVNVRTFGHCLFLALLALFYTRCFYF